MSEPLFIDLIAQPDGVKTNFKGIYNIDASRKILFILDIDLTVARFVRLREDDADAFPTPVSKAAARHIERTRSLTVFDPESAMLLSVCFPFHNSLSRTPCICRSLSGKAHSLSLSSGSPPLCPCYRWLLGGRRSRHQEFIFALACFPFLFPGWHLFYPFAMSYVEQFDGDCFSPSLISLFPVCRSQCPARKGWTHISDVLLEFR
jgi:hypothetical protein